MYVKLYLESIFILYKLILKCIVICGLVKYKRIFGNRVFILKCGLENLEKPITNLCHDNTACNYCMCVYVFMVAQILYIFHV